jgi:hypothetical protein
MRVVAVLERIGPTAIPHLETLSNSDPEAHMTREELTRHLT